MATATAPFDAYRLVYNSSHGGLYTTLAPPPLDAVIACYTGTTFVGRIEFHRAETSIDALRSEIKDGKPCVRYRIDRFRDVHQILLHEKPLLLYANDATGIGAVATTDYEPTGEEE